MVDARSSNPVDGHSIFLSVRLLPWKRPVVDPFDAPVQKDWDDESEHLGKDEPGRQKTDLLARDDFTSWDKDEARSEHDGPGGEINQKQG